MSKLHVGWDLDGVVSPFEDDLRHFAIEHLGYDPKDVAGGGIDDPDTMWNFPIQMWGWSDEQFLEYCHAAVDAGVLHVHSDPYEGAAEAMQEVADMGHHNHIITSRNFGTMSAANTEAWLVKHDIPYESLTFTRHKYLVRVDLHIDDHVRNFDEMRRRGLHCFLLDRPWNRYCTWATNFRVKSHKEFVERVKEYSNG